MQALPRSRESPSPARRPLTAAIRTAHAIRVYFDVDDHPQIIDVPMGQITCPFVERARAAGGVNLRIVALDRDGSTLDVVRVRA